MIVGQPGQQPAHLLGRQLRNGQFDFLDAHGRHVPCSHPVMYLCCASVRVSSSIPIDASLCLDTRFSTSTGTEWTLADSLPLFLTQNSLVSACVAKLMSMTLAGWPWAAARLTSRPSPRTYSRRPFLSTYSSTCSRTL